MIMDGWYNPITCSNTLLEMTPNYTIGDGQDSINAINQPLRDPFLEHMILSRTSCELNPNINHYWIINMVHSSPTTTIPNSSLVLTMTILTVQKNT